MSDFCVRFIDDEGEPIKDLTLNLENAGNSTVPCSSEVL